MGTKDKGGYPPRLVVDNDRRDSGEDRRKYAQSTSGRMSSQRTKPLLSRSMSIAKDSRIRCPEDTAFLKYPTEVLHRFANASCSGTGREFRKLSTDSMTLFLLNSKDQSIPFGKLPSGKHGYASPMEIEQIRTENFLKILRDQYRGSAAYFEQQTGYSQNMVTQIKNGHRKVSDRIARKLEKAMRKPGMSLDSRSDETQPAAPVHSWPLSVPLAAFEALPPVRRLEIDQAFRRMVLGTQAEEMANFRTPPARKKRKKEIKNAKRTGTGNAAG